MRRFPLLSLRILSPDGISLEMNDLTSVSVPLADGGWIGIKPGHGPLIAETVQGKIRFQTELSEDHIEVYPGILEIRENTVVILTAGEVSEQARFYADSSQLTYNRLMQAILGDQKLDNYSESIQGMNGRKERKEEI